MRPGSSGSSLVILALVASACSRGGEPAGVGGEPAGAGGEPAGVGGQGGGGADSSIGWGGEGSYEVVASLEGGRTIVDVATNDRDVYWLVASTQDELTLTYNSDGALYRRKIEGGEAELVVDGLLKPDAIRVTSEEAFLWFAPDTRTPDRPLFGRMDLDGGPFEPIDLPIIPYAWMFTAVGERAYLHHELEEESGIFEYRPGEEPERVLVISDRDAGSAFAVDETHIYYQLPTGGYRVLLTNEAEPELITTYLGAFDLALGEPSLVGLAFRNGALDVASMPTSGGSWQKFAEIPLRKLQGYSAPEAAGPRWFAHLHHEEEGIFVTRTWTGVVGDATVQVVPDILPDFDDWALSETRLFRSNATTLVQIPLD